MMKIVSTFLLLAGLTLPPLPLIADARGSSHLVDSMKPATTYIPKNAVDGDPSTAWVEGLEGPGLREFIEVDLPRGTINKIGIIPGYGPDERQFKRYSRIKELKVEIYSRTDEQKDVKVKEFKFNLQDSYGMQNLNTGDIKIGEELFGGFIRFTIMDVYQGLDFVDTAISEIKIFLEEFDAQLGGAAASSSREGNGPELAVDGDTRTAWVPGEGEGEGIGEWIQIDTGDYGVSTIGIIPGHGRDGAAWNAYSKPKDVVVEVAGRKATYTLKDRKEFQFFELPCTGGYTGSAFGPVKLTILTVYPGSSQKAPAISEIVIKATNLSM